LRAISVLKDAAAAAVYGLQSAGGVIIVTTKHGKVGENQITYDGSYGISKNANFPTFLNGPEYAYYYNKGLEMDGYSPIFTDDMVAKMTNGDDTDGWANTNWIKKVFGTGHNQKHTVTATGGNDNIKYFASLGYMGQDGNIKNFTYKRYNLRSNIDAHSSQRILKMSFGLAGQYGKQRASGICIAGGGEGG
jgi:TonB-dependent SusC/RagA subfamily outer membrane receptor